MREGQGGREEEERRGERGEREEMKRGGGEREIEIRNLPSDLDNIKWKPPLTRRLASGLEISIIVPPTYTNNYC